MAVVAQERRQRELGRTFTDLRRFAGLLHMSTKDPSEPPVPFTYNRWHNEQRAFERERTGRDLVLKPRQIGFSTLELARDLQYALTHPGSNVLIVVHDSDLAEALFLVLKTMHDSLVALGVSPGTKYSNKRELVFLHIGSAVRVVEAGASRKAAKRKGRSGTVHRLHATEVAFWEFPADSMAALLNCVPFNGEVCIESTPNGAAGMFYDMCMQAQAGKGDFRFHFYPWFLHDAYTAPVPDGFDPAPRDSWEDLMRDAGCDDSQIAWWRIGADSPAKGLETMLQEFAVDPQSCFRSSGRQYIDPRVLDRVSADLTDPLRAHRLMLGAEPLHVFRSAKRSMRYVVGADVAEGVGKDCSAITVIERRSGDVVAAYACDHIDPGDFGVVCAEVGRLYNNAVVAIERNNHGHASLVGLRDLGKYPEHLIYSYAKRKLGWETNKVTRPIMWTDLKMALREGAVSTPWVEHLVEMRSLIIDEDGKPRAQGKSDPHGGTDDRWTSWAIAWQVRHDARSNEQPAGHHIKGI